MTLSGRARCGRYGAESARLEAARRGEARLKEARLEAALLKARLDSEEDSESRQLECVLSSNLHGPTEDSHAESLRAQVPL